ncbi:uncharacterized protein B0H18DRAFT_1022635 [Fomitopsis serialis]|uniref:uncharacterized protein n=1 Tax=Fomitopsis serialis TaxID=139415 RepID=UPI002008BD52|nr:uncharacterized protein B0H18DRAFT_1022635 [Neoantrodia serialis]KAH9920913.1 hypothetical protein B0H18DRAFT_1022635 [Neoantrodia serialis]
MQQPEHNIIRNASTLSNILDFCTRRGLPSWRYFLTPPTTQLREAEEILQDIDAFLRNLSDEDKVKVDASIADVSTENASDAQTLMSIQQMLSNLDQAMQRRQQLSATWAAHPLMRFPWTDLSRSIRTLVMGCVGLRVAVKTSTARARERFPHGVPPVPGHTYASSHHSGSQGHSSSSHLGNQTHAAHATVGGDPTSKLASRFHRVLDQCICPCQQQSMYMATFPPTRVLARFSTLTGMANNKASRRRPLRLIMQASRCHPLHPIMEVQAPRSSQARRAHSPRTLAISGARCDILNDIAGL